MGVDRWLAPIVLDSTNNQFRVEETAGGGGVHIATIAAGTYYLHDDTSGTYSGLLNAIKLNLNANLNNTYSWEAITPSQSSSFAYNSGVKLRGTTGASGHTFDVDFGHVDFTMEPEWFGFRTSFGQLSISNNLSSATDGIYQQISCDYTLKKMWVSQTLHAGDEATEKVSRKVRAIEYSHQRPTDRYSVEWNEDQVRRFIYEYVPAVMIFEDRSDSTDSGWSTLYRKATRDLGNCWETIWSDLSRSGTCLVIHDEGDEDLNFLTNHLNQVEVVKLWDETQGTDLYNTVEIMRTRGGLYRVTVDVANVDTAVSTYKG